MPYNKYYKQKKQVSFDNGRTWQDVTPAEYQKGALYEEDSPDCTSPTVIYRWVNIDISTDWVCDETTYTKYYKQKKQASYDNGQTWQDVSPAEYQRGAVYETESTDCGFIPYSAQYFTTIALEDTTFSVSDIGYRGSVAYSIDNGVSWVGINSGEYTPLIHNGEKVLWKGNFPSYSSGEASVGTFSSSGNFNAEGNSMSLIYGDDFENKTKFKYHCLRGLFAGCRGLISAENLILPATDFHMASPYSTSTLPAYKGMFDGCISLTTAPKILPCMDLSGDCYFYMFRGCTSLTAAPELPATKLAPNCYLGMFAGCTSLTTAPELPATDISDCVSCYELMFSGCTSLITAPELPATNISHALRCYYEMFLGCTSLTTAPSILPATSSATNYCYQNMFSGCISLERAPKLPATNVSQYSYCGMFHGCEKLSYIDCNLTDLSPMDCVEAWTYGVAPTGTFIKNREMSSWPRGSSGIPEGWTVIDA